MPQQIPEVCLSVWWIFHVSPSSFFCGGGGQCAFPHPAQGSTCEGDGHQEISRFSCGYMAPTNMGCCALDSLFNWPAAVLYKKSRALQHFPCLLVSFYEVLRRSCHRGEGPSPFAGLSEQRAVPNRGVKANAKGSGDDLNFLFGYPVTSWNRRLQGAALWVALFLSCRTDFCEFFASRPLWWDCCFVARPRASGVGLATWDPKTSLRLSKFPVSSLADADHVLSLIKRSFGLFKLVVVFNWACLQITQNDCGLPLASFAAPSSAPPRDCQAESYFHLGIATR